MCTDELKAKLLPVNTALKTVAKNQEERARIRKRVKAGSSTAGSAPAAGGGSTVMAVDDEPSKPEEAVYLGTPEEETAKRAEEKALLEGLVDPGLKDDVGANTSGLYELCAVVTHKGASADSGHYMSFGSFFIPFFCLVWLFLERR